MPCLASSAPIALLSVGSMELMSITTRPSFAPSTTPFSPRTAALTCGEFGTMVITTSTWEARSLLLSAAVAPQDTRSATASLLKSKTTSSWPALTRFFAIGLPMIPNPINPIFILNSSLSLKKVNLLLVSLTGVLPCGSLAISLCLHYNQTRCIKQWAECPNSRFKIMQMWYFCNFILY